MDKLLHCVLHKDNEHEVKAILDTLFKPLQSSAPPRPSTSTSTATPSTSSSTSREEELLSQLVAMGFPRDQAKQALWATNYSIEAAIDFLSRS
jgi:uncharacterized UBP type Zn finger protein